MAELIATGNLGADAEYRVTPSGHSVLNFRIGDSKSKKDAQGNWEKVAENWFNVAIWGELAEFYSQKLTKGTRVKVAGEFYQREYDKRDGSGQGVSLDVRAWAIDIIPKRDNSGGAQSQAQQSNFQPPAQQATPQPNGGGQWAGQPAADPWGTNQSSVPF